jgi:hypothetical protein
MNPTLHTQGLFVLLLGSLGGRGQRDCGHGTSNEFTPAQSGITSVSHLFLPF